VRRSGTGRRWQVLHAQESRVHEVAGEQPDAPGGEVDLKASPKLFDMKAIRWPSGDQAARSPKPVSSVMWDGSRVLRTAAAGRLEASGATTAAQRTATAGARRPGDTHGQ
jgi:hypothetical protein